eukprot:TRINITY_DN4660_c0_g1_i1.p1 TRINITY_DN4660_c0_g1~~TRINITY_DN4660_c0_g1_i1.p1  ORF type:complete len:139 (+),score=38.01 TRINITY_DN4660_c0_g1_i1:72-488(+)
MVCYDVENKGFCPRQFCRWCKSKPNPIPGKGSAGGGKGTYQPQWIKAWQPKDNWQQQKKGGGKGHRDGFMCRDMKEKGECPRGGDCTWCKLMIEKYGTNDWSDSECWNMRMKGECKLKFCRWCPDKKDPVPGKGKVKW